MTNSWIEEFIQDEETLLVILIFPTINEIAEWKEMALLLIKALVVSTVPYGQNRKSSNGGEKLIDIAKVDRTVE